MQNRRIAIVGAGITGLTAAWSLEKRGHEVVVFERKDQPGGSVRSVQQNGWMFEYGPNTLQLKNRETLNLIEQFGLGDKLVDASLASASRYVVSGGLLEALPKSMATFYRSGLFSRRGKLRLLKEPFVGRGSDPDETLASFTERRLGREMLDYAVDPFVAGIYAGSPDRLSVRHAFPRLYHLEQQNGSLLAGLLSSRFRNRKRESFRTRLISFSDGLQLLPRVLAGRLKDIRYHSDVTRVQRGKEGWDVIADGVISSGFDRVLINIPLYRFNDQLINGGGEILNVLDIAGYPPLSVIHTGYRQDQIDHPLDGFGFLVPEVERRKILGSLFNSSLFPGRAPEGHALITTFVGGSRQPDLASLDSSSLKSLVSRELKDLLGVKGDPQVFDHVYWPKAIPQYTRRYGEVLQAIERVEDQNPGVNLIGNFRGGIALPDCMDSGVEWAEHISR